MRVITLHKNGEIEESTMQRDAFLGEYPHLNVRDLRPVFSPLQVATILPRSGTLVVNLGFVKAVIAKDNAHFLVPAQDHPAQVFLNELSAVLNSKDEEPTIFYLWVLEKILEQKIRQLNEKITFLHHETESVLERVTKEVRISQLEKLLALKKKISRLELRLGEIKDALDEVLEDEDFYTTIKDARANVTKSETESIVESFIEQVEDAVGNALRMKEDIEDTQEFLALKIDHSRNRIIKFDLVATSLALVFGLLAVVVGLFGVNLSNGLESSPEAFTTLRNSTILFAIVATVLIIAYFRRKDLF